VLHSFFADATVKERIQKLTGSRYYRLSYSLFAAISLALILWYQFSLQSIWLYSSLFIRYILSVIFIVPGLVIMVMCIRKYFYELSGIQALKNKPVEMPTLKQTGLHKYVRHPLYFGTLLFVWGLFLLLPSVSNLIAVVILTVYVLIGIHLEEQKLVLEYGEQYYQYAKKVPKLIPKFRWGLAKK
jgi:protein-S-isoprenylcysteine O-methyltransferase Ste14